MTDTPVIDAHHHIWLHARTPWLNGPAQPRIFGEYSALRCDYPASEFAATVTAEGVTRSVYIQVNVAPGAEVDEIEWVSREAARNGFPHACVGYADLANPGVARVLDRLQGAGALRGIRQQLHWHENPAWRFAARPDLMNDATWRAGLAEVERRGLLFELQVFASQMADAAALARAFPGLQFVLLHAGMLADRSPQGWAQWRAGMRQLAQCPNVAVKLSGLGTFERACSVVLWKPVIDQTLDLFGPDRCLYGSNFPIERLWTRYAQLMSVMRECLDGLSGDERRAVFHDTAERLYRLEERSAR